MLEGVLDLGLERLEGALAGDFDPGRLGLLGGDAGDLTECGTPDLALREGPLKKGKGAEGSALWRGSASWRVSAVEVLP